VSALGLALFLPGVGQMSFRDALSLLAPYSPRLAYNFIDPTNSLFQGNTLTPVTSVTNPVGVVIDQTQGGLGNLGAELAGSLPAPTISNNAGSVGAWNSGTRTMTNTGSTVAGFPRFRFNLGLVAGRHYLVTGQLSGDRTQLTGGTGIRLTDSGTANTVPYNSSTGVFYGIVPSASNIIEFVTELNGAESITIDSLSVREIPGNHATASSDAKRPLFARYPATGRRNLLIQTEGYSNAVWTKTTGTVPDNVTLTEPGGTRAEIAQAFAVVSGTSYTLSVVAKENPVSAKRYIALATSSVGFTNQSIAIFDLATGTKTFDNGNGSNYAITVEDDGYWRITNTDIATATTTSGFLIYTTNTPTGLTSAGGGSILLGGSQVETGSTATNYQKVVTSADITEAGVRDVYASLYDGSDDCLQVAGFDMSNTDKVTVIAGVRTLGASTGVIIETSSNYTGILGGFILTGPDSSNDYGFGTKGSGSAITYVATGFTAPTTNHISSAMDLAGAAKSTELFPRVDGLLQQTGGSGTNAGGGNFSNQTLNIGGRNNAASLPFNGHLHYLFICGSIVPDSILTQIYRGLGPRIGVAV